MSVHFRSIKLSKTLVLSIYSQHLQYQLPWTVSYVGQLQSFVMKLHGKFQTANILMQLQLFQDQTILKGIVNSELLK